MHLIQINESGIRTDISYNLTMNNITFSRVSSSNLYTINTEIRGVTTVSEFTRIIKKFSSLDDDIFEALSDENHFGDTETEV